MTITSTDLQFMARAIALAKNGLYLTNPNPAVGCVIVREEKIIAEGWTQKAGEAHAEVHALQNAEKKGIDVQGATAYVSLEPCSFTGKTGPCSQALINAKIKIVFYAMEDPNPKVAGDGILQLQQAGIDVVGPVSENVARENNPGFIKRMETGMPFVRIKMAMSVDGRTAMESGESKWITGPAARQDVQRLRARSCAVITGIETVLRDYARLTVREEELGLPNAKEIAARQPLRVVLDSSARIPESAHIFLDPGKILLVNAVEQSMPSKSAYPLENVEQVSFPDNSGKVHLRKMLKYLAKHECNEVLVEAGATLSGEFVKQGLVDEIIIYVAPKLLGSTARPLFSLPLETMAAQLPLSIQDIRAIGDDWRITAKIDRDV